MAMRVMPWGEEKQCTRCRGWWPCDHEFFRKRADGLNSWCRACEADHKRVKYLQARAQGRSTRGPQPRTPKTMPLILQVGA
jgi:hypothetical protein